MGWLGVHAEECRSDAVFRVAMVRVTICPVLGDLSGQTLLSSTSVQLSVSKAGHSAFLSLGGEDFLGPYASEEESTKLCMR